MGGFSPLETEKWLPVVGHEGFYEISSLGRVKRVASARGSKPGRILKPYMQNGYPSYALSVGCVVRRHFAHILVVSAFIGPKPTKSHEVAHNDGDRSNAALGNLRWATHIENEADKARHGTKLIGDACSWSKLNEKSVRFIRSNPTIPNTCFAAVYAVNKGSIEHVKHGRTWRHV